MKENHDFAGLIDMFLHWRGMSKNRLAKLSGISPAYMGQIVNKGRLPSLEVVKDIASGAMCSASQFLRAAGYETEAGLLLIRGLPGSGKTTMAERISDFMPGEVSRFEADMFFTDGESYNFDPLRIQEAHDWCIDCTFNALMRDRKVIVSNAFTRNWEMARYSLMASLIGVPFSIIEAKGDFESVHGVTVEGKEAMKERWESIDPQAFVLRESVVHAFMERNNITECFYNGVKFLFPRITHPRDGS